jgi:16S rRNA (uracil1498-N3)-methyltransferase
MRIPRIYQPGPLVHGSRVALTPGAAHHVSRVLRLRAGAELRLFDGTGAEFSALLLDAPRRGEVEVEVGERVASEGESRLQIHLLQGISRGERMDYTLQKAVELGVHAITPVFTERCVVNLDGRRAEQRLQHWHTVVVSACEQSGRNRIPALAAPMQLGERLHDPVAGLALALDPGAPVGLRSLPRPTAVAVTLLVGPEGGLSEAEVAAAVACGFQPLRLGPRVLRTETAGLAAITALQVCWGDMG